LIASLRQGIKDRDADALRNSLKESLSLPHEGTHIPLVSEARSILALVERQEEHQTLLQGFLEAGASSSSMDLMSDVDTEELRQALDEAINLQMQEFEVLKECESLMKRLLDIDECLKIVINAIVSCDLKQVKEAISKAKDLDLENHVEVQCANEMHGRLLEEAKEDATHEGFCNKEMGESKASASACEARAAQIQTALEDLNAALSRQKPHVGQVARAYRTLQAEMKEVDDQDHKQVDHILSERYGWTRARRFKLQETYSRFYTYVQSVNPNKVSGAKDEEVDDKDNCWFSCQRACS